MYEKRGSHKKHRDSRQEISILYSKIKKIMRIKKYTY